MGNDSRKDPTLCEHFPKMINKRFTHSGQFLSSGLLREGIPVDHINAGSYNPSDDKPQEAGHVPLLLFRWEYRQVCLDVFLAPCQSKLLL
jgi:hypothetical protein